MEDRDKKIGTDRQAGIHGEIQRVGEIDMI